MADTVSSKTILDGQRNVVMQFTNESDGTGESAVTKVDVSALSGAPDRVKIRRIKYATFGMSVNIVWDAATDVLAWSLPADSAGEFDFTRFGGITNDAGGGITGDVQFTTVGANAGDAYAIVLDMEKKWRTSGIGTGSPYGLLLLLTQP